MKNLFIILAVITGLTACQTADKKATGSLTQEEKEKIIKDSSSYTTIEWLDSTFRDLGKVKAGQVVEVSYRFKNTGTKQLVIADVSAQCGCTVPEKPEEPIAPGAEGVIKAKFDSKGRSGVNQKEVYVTSNTVEHRQTLIFSVEITD